MEILRKIMSTISVLMLYQSTYLNDAPEPLELNFQDSATNIMENINDLHNEIIFYLILLLIMVIYLLTVSLIDRRSYKWSPTHGTLLEMIWTISPALILIAIAFPSLRLLYLIDEVINPALTIKIIGHQWYWSTEYSDFTENNSFDSFMITTDELQDGQLRLLEVDNRILVPVDTSIRVIVTSADVIHSFGVPSLGVKVDAIPGRLNETSFFINRPGVFYGQCSELCGVLHGFMPIVIEAVDNEKFLSWISNI
jgi:cytochrome c oxidase subunit 2